jgi:transcriptional regulator with XRE-family HTH domain
MQNLVAVRKSARVSKARIAQQAGVSCVTIGRMENGGQVPSPRILRAYAETCGLDAHQLMLSWGIVPEEVLLKLQQNPQLVTLVLNS